MWASCYLIDGSAEDVTLIGNLPPVSFNKNITAPTVNPAMGLPTGARTRRAFPPAGFPVVGVPVPAVVAIDPHMLATGSATTVFNHDAGRRNANEDLRGQARPSR